MTRTTFTLTEPAPHERGIRKRWQLNGKDTSKAEIIKLLIKEGYKLTERTYDVPTIAKHYKGIEIGTMYWGLVIWAKHEKDTEKLLKQICKDGLFKSKCHNMPVEMKKEQL